MPSYDLVGKPGAEFFPAAPPPPPGFATQYDAEQTPERTLAHTNYGARLSYLHNGWDMFTVFATLSSTITSTISCSTPNWRR